MYVLHQSSGVMLSIHEWRLKVHMRVTRRYFSICTTFSATSSDRCDAPRIKLGANIYVWLWYGLFQAVAAISFFGVRFAQTNTFLWRSVNITDEFAPAAASL